MAKQIHFDQSQPFHQTNTCTYADAGFETVSLSVWQLKNFRMLPGCEKNPTPQQCIFKLKQEIKNLRNTEVIGEKGKLFLWTFNVKEF